MKTLSLFQQNPKEKKYRPVAATRRIAAVDLDRKGELEKFRKWLEFVSKEKSDLPKEEEFKKLEKDVNLAKPSKIGLLGVLAALPLAASALGIGGAAFGGLATIATGGVTALAGGVAAGASGLGGALGLGLGGFGIKKFLGKAGFKSAVKGTSRSTTGRRGVTSSRSTPGLRKSLGLNRGTAITQSGGGNVNRGGLRNPLRRRERPSRGRGGPDAAQSRYQQRYGRGASTQRFGIQRPQNPFRSRPAITRGLGGKNPIQGLVERIFKSKAGRTALAKTLGKFVKRIPFIGSLIGFAMDVFIFKVHPGKAAFKAIGSALGAGILGAMLSIVPGIGTAIGFIGGGYVGDMLGGWLYDKIFNKGQSPNIPAAADERSEEELMGTTDTGQLTPMNNTGPSTDFGNVSMTGSRNGPLTDVISQKAIKETYGVATGPVRTRGRSSGHGGVDIGTGSQTGYYVAYRRSGRVSLVQYLSGYGNTVIIQIGNLDFIFAHLARKSNLKPGQPYNGEIIGEIGNTGRSFGGGGQHLHFEVRPAGGGGGSDIDPEPYVSALVIGRLDPDKTSQNNRVFQLNPSNLPARSQNTEQRVDPQVAMLESYAKRLDGLMSIFNVLLGTPDSKKSVLAKGSTEIINSVTADGAELLGTASSEAPPVASTTPKDMNVSMLTPEAEAANSDNIVVIREVAPPQQQQGGDVIPIPIGSSGGSNGNNSVIVAGVSLDSMIETLMLTKLDGA